MKYEEYDKGKIVFEISYFFIITICIDQVGDKFYLILEGIVGIYILKPDISFELIKYNRDRG
jgi:hypothetical protein